MSDGTRKTIKDIYMNVVYSVAEAWDEMDTNGDDIEDATRILLDALMESLCEALEEATEQEEEAFGTTVAMYVSACNHKLLMEGYPPINIPSFLIHQMVREHVKGAS